MRNFILGAIVLAVIVILGGLAFVSLGFMPTNADATPPHMETKLAMNALDASMEKHAPRANNPIPPTDENLIEGMKVYTMNCSLCHGSLDLKPSALANSLYPPPPQLILHPSDDPEWHVFYATRTGVRYTGMPAWGRTLNEDQMWKVTAFLTRLEKRPPGVLDYWKKSFGVTPQQGAHEGMKDSD